MPFTPPGGVEREVPVCLSCQREIEVASISAASISIVTGAWMALPLAAPTQAAAPRPYTFANCTAMNKVFPHGFGRPGAVDRTSGVRVTNSHRSTEWYNKNTKSDRDRDGIACEKA